MKGFRALIGFLALVFFISALSSIVTMPAVTSWYQYIIKPAWTPPDWVFGPVWTALYLMIAISGWRVWRILPAQDISARILHPALRAYWLQLAFNFIWSWLFFGLRQPLLAGIDIMILLAAIILNIRCFYTVDKPAAWLLAPYALWVAYAATLNIGIIVLN